MLKNKLTLVINSCDKFSDLWNAHFNFLDSNWLDRDVRTILLTDKETDFTHKGVEVVSAGEGLQYPNRMKKLLPSVTTEYVFITLDDYFPINRIENEKIENLCAIMDREHIDYLRLFPDPNSHKRFKPYKTIYKIDMRENYAVNLYQGIWRKDFLQSTFQRDLSIWDYEVSLTYIARARNAKCMLGKGKEFEILDVIRKGKLLHKAYRYLKKKNVELPQRELISYSTELRNFLFDATRKALPRSLANGAKGLMRKFGVSFISDRISNEMEKDQ